ncbi:hypothetical protein L596_027640 [Steinernema carpocapsae]|uniref:Uncharacterized protein n=1 Tax=Steinernema carpocapsae TaxID=34508 RepID=A0A4V5ZXN2_STECR|nr:hypothetical protein L596_027640 [Steinernema carpocapsae]
MVLRTTAHFLSVVVATTEHASLSFQGRTLHPRSFYQPRNAVLSRLHKRPVGIHVIPDLCRLIRPLLLLLSVPHYLTASPWSVLQPAWRADAVGIALSRLGTTSPATL